MTKYIKYFLYLIGILLIGVFFLLFIWPLAPDVLLWRFSDSILANSDDALTKKGQFGDSFGGINALLSGVALIGVIIAIILQWLALKNQHQEMKEQKLAMQQETFERTFFHLLEAIKECYHSTEHTKFVEVPLGADVAQHQEDILQSYRKINSPNPIIVSEPFTDLDGVRGVNVTTVGDTAFVSVIKNNINTGTVNMNAVDSMYLEPYFFLVFSALNLAYQIKFCETFEEKKFYTDILRSQMPDCGVQALCMYLATDPPRLDEDECHGKVLKEIIEEYALFANIRGPNLIKEHILQYKRSAFGNNRPDIDKIFDAAQQSGTETEEED